MKFALLLCVISVAAFAQQKDKAKQTLDSILGPHPFGKNPPKNLRYQQMIDSADMEFSWDDIYKAGGFGPCFCPTPGQVQQMPRENSPYQWDNKKIIIKLDSAGWEYFKNKLTIDSARFKKLKPML